MAAQPSEIMDIDRIFDFLADNEQICFKSQQLGESDLTLAEKKAIAAAIYTESKVKFLLRFGKYLERPHLAFFQQYSTDSAELTVILRDLQAINKGVKVKNRRYQALKLLSEKGTYFSEIEMMKRNPLLYEQLVGQYLTREEKIERDRLEDTTTLVKVLMEGIEREDAKLKKKEQEEREAATDEDNSSDSSDSQPTYTQWGEFHDEQKVLRVKKAKRKQITPEEQQLLKEEFITLMHHQFLEGKDEDFDYGSVDHNEMYDDVEMKECDAEERYFDSEEPEMVMEAAESSEDELDIFMSGLNHYQNAAVSKLSKDIENL